MSELNQHILKEISAIDILAKLIKLRQVEYPWKTISWYSRKLGLKSRSNLSEAIRGKRPLKQEHWRPLLQYLELSKSQQDYILLMLEYERTTSSNNKQTLSQRLTIARKVLEGPLEPHASIVQGMNLAHEIYCAISTFERPPSGDDIRRFFGREKSLDIDPALHKLIEEGLIELKNGAYHHKKSINKQMLKLHSESNKTAEIKYLKQAISRAGIELESWYHRADLSFFGTSIISVKRAEYEKALQDFKRFILARCLELETEDADMLISVNFQVYPTGKLPSPKNGDLQ